MILLRSLPMLLNKQKYKPKITSLYKKRHRIENRIKNSYSSYKLRKTKRNFYRRSYLSRFILRKKKIVKKMLINANKLKKFSDYDNEESKIFYDLRDSIKHYEYKNYWKRKSNAKMLHKRAYSFGKLFFTMAKRNTFITIQDENGKVKYKLTAGLLGYLGPKRMTRFAREAVTKAIGNYFADNDYSSIDIIFTNGIKKYFRKMIRFFFTNFLYVRYILIPKRRPHGHARLKKVRRV